MLCNHFAYYFYGEEDGKVWYRCIEWDNGKRCESKYWVTPEIAQGSANGKEIEAHLGTTGQKENNGSVS